MKKNRFASTRPPAAHLLALIVLGCLLLAPQASAAPGQSPILEAARGDGELTTGEFNDEIVGWDRKDVKVYWKRLWYRPVRCADNNGDTLYHLWLDQSGTPITDETLIEELFTALLFLQNPTPTDLARSATQAETRAAVYKQEEADYTEITGEATAVQIAAEAFSIYMSLQNTDPAKFWDYLAGSISVYNSIDLFSNLMKLYGNADDLTEEGVRTMLEDQRTNLMHDILGKHYSRADLGKSVAGAAALVKQRHDLSRALETESNLLHRFRIKGSLAKADLNLREAATTLGWSLFTYIEDTGGVAQQAAEFALMNRTAYMCHLKIADIYRRAAEGNLQDADETQLLSLWVPMTTELRGKLLERYLNAYRERKKTFSGAIWSAYETARGMSVEEAGEQAITTNADLLVMEQEHFRKALIALEVEMSATMAALRRADNPPDDDAPGDTVARDQDLGNVTYSQAPKTWTINVPENFAKVEVAHYSYGTDEQRKYSGWNGSLKVNGKYAWKFVRFDSKLGGIVHDYVKGENVRETTGRGAYLDITSMVTPGENTITYYHFTEGPGIGVKIRIHRR